MKYMIISDIHGSETATIKALDWFDRMNCDVLVILGDVLYHGPRNPLPEGHNPKGVVQLLNQRKDLIFAVRGNCEAEVDQMVLDFPCLAEYNMIMDNGIRIFATHGHHHNPQNLPSLPVGSVFLYGHTHLWENSLKDGLLICNPGSVALPKENRDASFAVYENGVMRVLRLEDASVLSEQRLA